MDWNVERQARFDQLRAGELAGTLTVQEEAELAELVTLLEADEARRLTPALGRMRTEQVVLHQQLVALQSENEELAQLLAQQERLVADARLTESE